MSTTDLEITKDTVQARSVKPSTAKDTKGMGFGFGECGALPHAPAGRSSPCTPGTSTTCLKATQEGEQEIQEMQEIQERPCGASVKPSF